MTQTFTCQDLSDRLEHYLKRTLTGEESALIDSHLLSCKSCEKAVRCSRAVHELIEYVQAEPKAAALEQAPQQHKTFVERLGAAPWMFVSFSMHFLVIALASLISMAIEMPRDDSAIIMITELQPRNAQAEEVQPVKSDRTDVLQAKETPATDPNSTQFSDVVVPPDILAKAELGDHFETINLDRPDTHNAYGNEDAKLFYSVNGNAEAAGGGGTSGIGMEDVIGVGGAGMRGTGGGFGGGDGTGTGVGHGAGHGSFGQRSGGGRRVMVEKHGGSKATEGAVDRGLDWLARNQEADGHWDMVKHGGKGGAKLSDKGNCPATGLAILAFLGAGHTEKLGKYKENVRKGVAWLKTQQNYDTGFFCDYNYGHAIAGMAMAEAAGMSRIPETMESAQKAVDVTAAVHKKYPTSERGGWSYEPEQRSAVVGCDMSNSGWAFMFLKSAKVAGLKVPHEAIEGVKTYLDACESGKVPGDTYSGHKYSYLPKQPDVHRGYIAILGRLFFGTPANEVEDGVKWELDFYKLPNPQRSQQLYYYYYMTLTTFQIGGDVWKDWNEALKNSLPPTQIKGGVNDGSWDPYGWLSDEWGRVGDTSLSILCMEVYYRYQKLNDNK